MNYWQFFPAPDGWGIVPVWGFADVALTRHPMATHAVLLPAKITRRGFVDGAAHRGWRRSITATRTSPAIQRSATSAPMRCSARCT